MNKKLDQLFAFLTDNRIYNKELQGRYYFSVVQPYDNIPDKIISLLYSVVNSQSQPRIDKIAEFFKSIQQQKECLKSFENYVKHVNTGGIPNYKNLFLGLRKEAGWGDKTSALFAKSIFHLHNGDYSEEIAIWNDAPTVISGDDDFYLPVDSVIIAIFKKLDPSRSWDFHSINKRIKKQYTSNEVEVWDDLWFWGFITQSGSGANRKHEWNLNKYWALKESDKEEDTIRDIHAKAQVFLQLLN